MLVPKEKIPLTGNPAWFGNPGSIDEPCCTIVARQDKAPLYLITLKESPGVSIPIYDTDSPVMIRIKEFMALYGIVDITMRMLKVQELLAIQGFSKDYILVGTQTDQKKFIGNSVPPKMVTALMECLYDSVIDYQMAA